MGHSHAWLCCSCVCAALPVGPENRPIHVINQSSKWCGSIRCFFPAAAHSPATCWLLVSIPQRRMPSDVKNDEMSPSAHLRPLRHQPSFHARPFRPRSPSKRTACQGLIPGTLPSKFYGHFYSFSNRLPKGSSRLGSRWQQNVRQGSPLST